MFLKILDTRFDEKWSDIEKKHEFSIILLFLTFELMESFRNRSKTILLDQELNFKKNPIEKYFFIMEKNDFEKNVRKKNENLDFFN